jgi:hypothetical protein
MKQQLVEKYWLEFVKWAHEPRRVSDVGKEYQLGKQWDKEWDAPIWSDGQAEAAGRLHDPSLLRHYCEAYCVVGINEDNFWRWLVDTRPEVFA